MSEDNVDKVEAYIKITQATVFIVGILVVVVMIMSYIKKMLDGRKRVIKAFNDIGTNTSGFIISLGDMLSDGVVSAISTTKESLIKSGNVVKDSADNVGENVINLGSTVTDGVTEVSDEISMLTSETSNNFTELTNAVHSMVPNINQNDLDMLTKEIDDINNNEPDVIPPDPEDVKFLGRWLVNGSNPPEYFNIVHVGGDNYNFYYNPNYVAIPARVAQLDPIGYYELVKHNDGMFGIYTMTGYTDLFFVLRMPDETSMEWIFLGVNANDEHIYNPNADPVDVFTKQGEVQYDPITGNMIF